MTIRTRRILYSFFLVLFFAAAPPLVLYTAGYRYDWQYRRVVETGSLVISTWPREAKITLNNEPKEDQTPAIINTILPGKINLLIAKAGYYPWEKTVEVAARVTTFIEDVRLFAITEPDLIKQDVTDYWINPAQTKIVYATTNHELRLLNLFNKKDALVANLAGMPLVDLAWSPRQEEFFFGRARNGVPEYFVVDGNLNEAPAPLRAATPRVLAKVTWDPASDHTLYALSRGALYRIPYLLKTERLVLSGPIRTYEATSERISFIDLSSKKGTQVLAWILPSNPSTVHYLPDAVVTKDAEFHKTNSHLISLLDKNARKLVIVDPTISEESTEERVTVVTNVKHLAWSGSGRKLAYSDGYALREKSFTTPITVIPSRPASELITRYSEPIESIAWLSDEAHILYGMTGTLRVAETVSSTAPRTLTIATIPGAQKISHLYRPDAALFITKDNKFMSLQLSIEDDGVRLFGSQ